MESVNLSSYEYPHPEPESSPFQTIAILGTSDMHGQITSTDWEVNSSLTLKQGGLILFRSYLKAMREEWKENLLWLDAGDQFQGTLESNMFNGSSMTEFYNFAGLDCAVIGNHEFDFGFDALTDRFQQSNFPYLGANLFNRSSKQFVQFPNFFQSYVKTIHNITIGIIGLIANETPTISGANLSNFSFESYEPIIESEAAFLRQSKHASIIVLLVPFGTACSSETPFEIFDLKPRNSSSRQGACSKNSELFQVLNRIKPGVVDVWVGGHTHTMVHH